MDSATRAFRRQLQNSGLDGPTILEDTFLRKFLWSCNFNIHESHKLLNTYLAVRTAYPHLFGPPRLYRKVFEDDIIGVLPYKGPEKETLVLSKPGNWNPHNYDIYHVLGAAICLYEKQALELSTQKNGVIVIVDMKGTSWRQLGYIPLSAMKLGVDLTQNTLPIRFKKIHIINHNWVSEAVYSLVSPFLSRELCQRIFFHAKKEDIQNYIPKLLLPMEYGGRQRPFHSLTYYNHVLLGNK